MEIRLIVVVFIADQIPEEIKSHSSHTGIFHFLQDSRGKIGMHLQTRQEYGVVHVHAEEKNIFPFALDRNEWDVPLPAAAPNSGRMPWFYSVRQLPPSVLEFPRAS